MNTPHVHAEVMIAWLNDQSIKLEYKTSTFNRWIGQSQSVNPVTHPLYEWRIKPEPEPDVVRYLSLWHQSGYSAQQPDSNLKVTFDGETNKPKSAEVI